MLIDAGYKKTIFLCKDMLNKQMYYVLNTGRHVTLTGIMYKLSRIAHAVSTDWKNYNLEIGRAHV